MISHPQLIFLLVFTRNKMRIALNARNIVISFHIYLCWTQYLIAFIKPYLFLDRINMSLTDILSAEAIDNALKDCEGELNQN